MQRLISSLCLFVAILVCSQEAFAQARSPVTAPPATRPEPTIEQPEYFGKADLEEFSTPNGKVGGVKISYYGKGSESSKQAAINHRRGVDQVIAASNAQVNSLPKTIEKTVVKEVVRPVVVRTPPTVIYVDPYPVRIYRNGFYHYW